MSVRWLSVRAARRAFPRVRSAGAHRRGGVNRILAFLADATRWTTSMIGSEKDQ